MNIQPINFADFDLVIIKGDNTCRPTPHCKKHGAMNKMNVHEDSGGIWRCISVVTNQTETACRAGCCEIRK